MQRDLVDRAMAGDHDAFKELTRVAIDRLYVVARLILRDDGKAEEATQEALMAAWRRLHPASRSRQLRGHGSIASSLTRAIAKRAATGRRKSFEVQIDPLFLPERHRPDRHRRRNWPTATRSNAGSGGSTWTSGPCWSCTTTSGSASTRRRRSSAFRRGPSLAAQPRDQRDARGTRGRRSNAYDTRQDGRHDVAADISTETTSTGSCASGWTTTLSRRIRPT